jgi:hypothetical protein
MFFENSAPIDQNELTLFPFLQEKRSKNTCIHMHST